MRIQGSTAAALSSGSGAARSAPSGTFSLSETGAGRQAAGAGTLRAIGGIETLVALQGVDDLTERRRRSSARGKAALDTLDDLKVSLLSGGLEASTLQKLKAVAAQWPDDSGDPRLDGVLAEIGLRVEVEIAKLSRR